MLGPPPLPQPPWSVSLRVLNHTPPRQDQPVWGVGTGLLMETLFSPRGEVVMTGLWSGLGRTQGGVGNRFRSVLHVPGS